MRFVTKKTISVGGIILISLVLLGFVFNGIYALVVGPSILITYPENGVVVSDALLKVEGAAHNIAHITLNGQSISVDEEGHFERSLILAPGYNIIEVTAQDRFGRNTTEQVAVIHK